MYTITNADNVSFDTIMRCSQRQSLLFRLPRELRDSIYIYYAFEDEGCIYDYDTGKLRYANGRTLALRHTCKAAAEELRGIALQANKITFTPGYSDATNCYDSGYRGLRSKAGRFECLLQYTRWTKILMLRRAAGCVSSELLSKVVMRYPGVDGHFQQAFGAIRGPIRRLQRSYRFRHQYRDIFFASFCDAVQYTLELASAHPGFESCISLACGQSQGVLGRSPFVAGSHWTVLNWNPQLWSCPSEDELNAMEKLLTEPGSCGDFSDEFAGGDFDCAEEYRHVKWFFSATAVAIRFLSSLTRAERMRLRRIVLDENKRGVANPECHAEGLIPFCRENPNLHITVLASIWTNMAPSIWVDYWNRGIHEEPNLLPAGQYLNVIVDWITRTTLLSSIGMPSRSYSLVFEGRLPETVQIWTLIKRAAAFKEAILDCTRRRGSAIIEVYDSFDEVFYHPWCLPSSFPSAIREIVRGQSVFQYNGIPGELWDREEMAEARMHWSTQEWSRDYMPLTLDGYFPISGGARKLFDVYNAE